MRDKQNVLESYFAKHFPELKVYFEPYSMHDGVVLLKTAYAFQVGIHPQDSLEQVQCYFLDELYKMIGKLTVTARRMEETPIGKR